MIQGIILDSFRSKLAQPQSHPDLSLQEETQKDNEENKCFVCNHTRHYVPPLI